MMNLEVMKATVEHHMESKANHIAAPWVEERRGQYHTNCSRCGGVVLLAFARNGVILRWTSELDRRCGS